MKMKMKRKAKKRKRRQKAKKQLQKEVVGCGRIERATATPLGENSLELRLKFGCGMTVAVGSVRIRHKEANFGGEFFLYIFTPREKHRISDGRR
jgi:hypothetical protein